MKIQRQTYFLRSRLLRMAMLSQRAVDYSIKVHEFGAPEIHGLFGGTTKVVQSATLHPRSGSTAS
jgi:hypothetical protein